MKSPALALAALLALLAVAGCASSPPTQLFDLAAEPGGARADYAGAPIQVRSVHLPAELDRPQILAEDGSGRVKAHPFAQWAAPVAELAAQTLTADLAGRLPKGAVLFPESVTPSGAHLLSVDIVDLRLFGGAASAEASWTVTTPGPTPRAPALVSTGAATLRVDGAGSGPAGDADALARLLGALADQIAASL